MAGVQRGRLAWLAGAIMLAGAAAPAAAGWQRAESRHFVIYGEGSAKALADYATRLEKFDKATRLVLRKDDPEVGDGNRVHIYRVDNLKAIEKLVSAPLKGRNVAGFYMPRYSGPVAFVPAATSGQVGAISPDSTLFHEYGHHLMWQDIARPYPNWYVEGFAELIGTPRFVADGSLILGLVPPHRAMALTTLDGMTIRQMLTAQPEKMSLRDRSALYAKGWLLSHYLTFEPSRAGQLSRYLDVLAAGGSESDAAAVLGDLDQLEKQLGDYLKRTRLGSVTIAADALSVAPVTVTALSDGANKAMPLHLRLQSARQPGEAASLLASAQALAAAYPADPFVQKTLAEAALNADRPDLALTAADTALRAAPRDGQALILRGKARVRTGTDLDAARRDFIAANHLDTEDPEPLVEYYRSFAAGAAPKSAVDGLHYAAALMPGDRALRLNSAVLWLVAGKADEAAAALLPVAFDPHGGPLATQGRAMLDRLKAGDLKGARASGAARAD